MNVIDATIRGCQRKRRLGKACLATQGQLAHIYDGLYPMPLQQIEELLNAYTLVPDSQ